MTAASVVGHTYVQTVCANKPTHRRELAATLFGALRGAAYDDARGDACKDPAEGADDAVGASAEANHREDGAAGMGEGVTWGQFWAI